MNKLNILYEDNHIIVVVKPYNVLSQADDTKDIDMLTMIKDYIKEKYNKPGNVYLGLVHRLDRPTEGIMVYAKTSKAAERLTKQINNKEFNKTYYAVVEGITTKGTLKDYLTKDEKTNTSYISNEKNGKLSILEYTTIKSKDNLSLVKINLLTGRHHQIRVQFSSRNHPLYGDHKYNKKYINDNKENICLIAACLSFYHPTTKELLHFEIDLPKKYPYSLF